MKLDRLFHVLVVMSAAPVLAGCESSEDDSEERRDDKTDAGVDPDNAAPDAAAMSTGDAGALDPCFCDTQTCCDRSGGQPHVLDGFECCWSTTCP